MAKKVSYTNEFKAKVALDAIRGDKTVAQIVSEYRVASSLVSKWKSDLLANAGSAFASKNKISHQKRWSTSFINK